MFQIFGRRPSAKRAFQPGFVNLPVPHNSSCNTESASFNNTILLIPTHSVNPQIKISYFCPSFYIPSTNASGIAQSHCNIIHGKIAFSSSVRRVLILVSIRVRKFNHGIIPLAICKSFRDIARLCADLGTISPVKRPRCASVIHIAVTNICFTMEQYTAVPCCTCANISFAFASLS